MSKLEIVFTFEGIFQITLADTKLIKNIPVIQALFAEAAPLKYRATFMSVSGMTFRVGQTLGPLLMGMVISIWGIGGAFYAGAGLSIVMFIIMFMLE